jgi:hypothetical protein
VKTHSKTLAKLAEQTRRWELEEGFNCTKAKVTGKWHDNRHTLITDLGESGVGDENIRDIAGHVSKQMLKHYSHIRMEAKREALQSIVAKKEDPKPEVEKAADSTEDLQAKPQGGRDFRCCPTKVPTVDRLN